VRLEVPIKLGRIHLVVHPAPRNLASLLHGLVIKLSLVISVYLQHFRSSNSSFIRERNGVLALVEHELDPGEVLELFLVSQNIEEVWEIFVEDFHRAESKAERYGQGGLEGGGVGRITVEVPDADEVVEPLEQLVGHLALEVFGNLVDVEVHCEQRVGTIREHLLGEDPAHVIGQEDDILLRDLQLVHRIAWSAMVDFVGETFRNSLEACWRGGIADDQLIADAHDILLLVDIVVDHVTNLLRKALEIEAVFLRGDVWSRCGSGRGEWGGSHGA
jgi:hypothetical protein